MTAINTQLTPLQEAQDLAVILRNLKCDVVVDPLTDYYRVNDERFHGVYSFIACARKALEQAGVKPP